MLWNCTFANFRSQRLSSFSTKVHLNCSDPEWCHGSGQGAHLHKEHVIQYVKTRYPYSYGHLPVISSYNPIYRMYPYPVKNVIWGGGVVLEFHFKITFIIYIIYDIYNMYNIYIIYNIYIYIIIYIYILYLYYVYIYMYILNSQRVQLPVY